MINLHRTRLRPGLRRTTSTTTAAPSSAEATETTASAGQSNGSGEAVETTPIPSRTIGYVKTALFYIISFSFFNISFEVILVVSKNLGRNTL